MRRRRRMLFCVNFEIDCDHSVTMTQDLRTSPSTDKTRLRVLLAGAILSAALALQNIHITLLSVACFM